MIDEAIFKNFTEELDKNYGKNNAYHNQIHGADVRQTFFVFLFKGNLQEVNNYFIGNFVKKIIWFIKCGFFLNKFFLQLLKLQKINLNDIDIFSSLIAAMCHDFKHSGFTNNFEINFKTQIALTYNGKF